jgi:hypothetical protein
MFSNVKEKITRHIQIRIDLLKLEVIHRSSGIMSYFMFALICLFIFFSVIMFLGFGLSELFIDAGMSRGASFLLTTGLYLLLLTTIILLRGRITRFFSSTFISILTETSEEKEGTDDEDNEKEATPNK